VSAATGSLAIDRAGLDELFAVLERRGYTLVGPTVRDRAIMLEELDSAAELPAGWTDVQEGGTYGIEGERVAAGKELSPAVAAAVEAVERELRGRLGKSAAGERQAPDGGTPAQT
jgi:hypothetical protein